MRSQDVTMKRYDEGYPNLWYHADTQTGNRRSDYARSGIYTIDGGVHAVDMCPAAAPPFDGGVTGCVAVRPRGRSRDCSGALPSDSAWRATNLVECDRERIGTRDSRPGSDDSR